MDDEIGGPRSRGAEEEGLADELEAALGVVLARLPAEERIVFVLCCCFGLAPGDVAPIVGRSEEECRALAERVRARVAGGEAAPGPWPSPN